MDPNEVTSDRRKACDLCSKKKIKCDQLRPTCSNCRLYKAECRTTPLKRKVVPTTRKPVPASQGLNISPPESSSRTEALEFRLANIETQLQQFISLASAALLDRQAQAQAQPQQPQFQQVTPVSQNPSSHFTIHHGNASWTPDSLSSNSPAAEVRRKEQRYDLPPLEDILPVIDSYFHNFNSVTPLFQRSTFMRTLQTWYSANSSASPRCPAAWAAVNVVLALGRRMPDQPTNDVDVEVEDPFRARCVRNIESVLPHLATHEEDLLGLQSMMGLVLLLLDRNDPRPASSLVATTVRLAHRLSVHSPDISMRYSDAENAQRARVFWILYTVEKELCLRLQTPSVIDDNDISIPLPPAEPTDGAGDLYYHATDDSPDSAPRIARFNIFRAAVQLARIQGLIYSHLYSARSARLPIAVRRQRVEQIDSLLKTWRESLPPELQLGYLTRRLQQWRPGDDNYPPGITRQLLAHLAPVHLMAHRCFVMTHGIYSQNAGWIRRCMSSYGRVALRDAKDPVNGTCYEQLPPLPGSWTRCVDFSRDSLKLISALPKSDWSIWTMGCAYFSALLIILANIVEFPGTTQAELDQKLARPALELICKVLASSDWAPLQQLYIVLMEIDRAAVAAVRNATEAKMMIGSGMPEHQPVVRQEASDSATATPEEPGDWALTMGGHSTMGNSSRDLDLLGENGEHPFEDLDLENLDLPEQWQYGDFTNEQLALDPLAKTSDQVMAAAFDMWSFGDHALIDHSGNSDNAFPYHLVGGE